MGGPQQPEVGGEEAWLCDLIWGAQGHLPVGDSLLPAVWGGGQLVSWKLVCSTCLFSSLSWGWGSGRWGGAQRSLVAVGDGKTLPLPS